MTELIKYIAQSLVDNPDKVEVNEVIGEQTSIIELSVAKEDIGKIYWEARQNGSSHPQHFVCHVRQSA